MTFDTLKFAKRLKEAGFAEQQAEAEFIEENLATKRDIAEPKRGMEDLEYRMTIKLGALMIGAMATLVKLL